MARQHGWLMGPASMPRAERTGVNRRLIRPAACYASKVESVAAAIRPPTSAKVPGVRIVTQPDITLYSTAICPYCVAAKNFLKSKGLQWQEVRIDTDPVQRELMQQRTRRTSVPQIFVGDTHVGGYDDMMALHRAGKFEPLLQPAAGE